MPAGYQALPGLQLFYLFTYRPAIGLDMMVGSWAT